MVIFDLVFAQEPLRGTFRMEEVQTSWYLDQTDILRKFFHTYHAFFEFIVIVIFKSGGILDFVEFGNQLFGLLLRISDRLVPAWTNFLHHDHTRFSSLFIASTLMSRRSSGGCAAKSASQTASFYLFAAKLGQLDGTGTANYHKNDTCEHVLVLQSLNLYLRVRMQSHFNRWFPT